MERGRPAPARAPPRPGGCFGAIAATLRQVACAPEFRPEAYEYVAEFKAAVVVGAIAQHRRGIGGKRLNLRPVFDLHRP
jgi:hypothetical protein